MDALTLLREARQFFAEREHYASSAGFGRRSDGSIIASANTEWLEWQQARSVCFGGALWAAYWSQPDKPIDVYCVAERTLIDLLGYSPVYANVRLSREAILGVFDAVISDLAIEAGEAPLTAAPAPQLALAEGR